MFSFRSEVVRCPIVSVASLSGWPFSYVDLLYCLYCGARGLVVLVCALLIILFSVSYFVCVVSFSFPTSPSLSHVFKSSDLKCCQCALLVKRPGGLFHREQSKWLLCLVSK